MNTKNQAISFVQDAQLVDDLLALLTREQGYLVKVDVEAIEGVLDEKSLLLQRLNIAAKSRYTSLAAGGFDANEAGMDLWVQQQNKPELSVSWAKFQKSLTEAKELNRLNGVLISKHFNRNQELLNHIQGHSESDSVYGRDGQTKSKVSSRTGLVV